MQPRDPMDRKGTHPSLWQIIPFPRLTEGPHIALDTHIKVNAHPPSAAVRMDVIGSVLSNAGSSQLKVMVHFFLQEL